MNGTLITAVLAVALLGGLPAAAVADDGPATMDFDLLAAPVSPAFVVLDAAPEAIERPGSVTDFSVSLQNASNDFSTLPANYAATFAPYWIFGGGKKLTYADYATGRSPLLRTTTVSLATTTADDSLGNRVRSLGAGLRLTLFEGAIDSEFGSYQTTLDSLYEDLEKLNEIVDGQIHDRLESDTLYKSLEAQEEALQDQRDAATDARQIAVIEKQIEVVAELMNARLSELHGELMTALRADKQAVIAAMQQRAQNLRVRRLGFNLDLAGGASWTFPDQEWDQGRLRKAGAWLTAAYEGRDLSGVLLARYLRDDLLDLGNVDLGLRLLTTRGRFSFSGEAVYRNSSKNEIVDDSWRYDLVLDYQYGDNKKVGLTFGKDFDGSPDGNVLAILNLVFGLGSERPLLQ